MGWYVSSGGVQSGPHSWEDLGGLIRTGELEGDDLVWHASLGEWTRADLVSGLVVPVPLMPNDESAAASVLRSKRPGWLIPVVVAVILLVVGGIAGGAYALLHDAGDERPGSGSVGAAIDKVIDLGTAEVVDADPSSVVETDRYGRAPANHVLVVMVEGQGRGEAEGVATRIGGSVVGEIEFLDLYQIQTSGVSAGDLEAAIGDAAALPGVRAAFPNGVQVVKAPLWGKTCSPMHDPLYSEGDNVAPFKMIGMMEAWALLGASGVALHDTHVGVVDSAVYTLSGHTLAPELYFPDGAGAYTPGKVRVCGLEPKDTTDQPARRHGGLTHGTMVTHVIGADPGGGAAGVAAVLGDKLTITCGNALSGSVGIAAEEGVDLPEEAAYLGFYVRALVEIVRQIEAGAKVINLSYGPDGAPDEQYAWQALVYRDFFEKMNTAHPDVLFVAAAGQENGALDGSNFAPGGIKAPNVITVGMLDRSGDRATVRDLYGPERLQADYEELIDDGTIPADWTLEDMLQNAKVGSNYATGDGEVTLSACGIDVPVGRYPDGDPVVVDGTSISAPQVTAAAAMLKAIDPALTAQQIKDILVRTAATEVESNGTVVAVPAEVGGRVLRVDYAVLDAINRVRGAGNELVYGDLIDLFTVSLRAEGDSAGYAVEASVPAVGPSGTELTISVVGKGDVAGDAVQHIATATGTATWVVRPDGGKITIKVHRSDSGGCAFLVLDPAAETPNEPPAAEPISTSTEPETPAAITLKGADPDGDDLTYAVVRAPAKGKLTGSPPFLTYTPRAGFSGTDSFTYKVSDGRADSPAATVEIAVYGLRWVRVGPPAVNPDKERLESHGGGSTPGYFGEPRFDGMFTVYRVSETNFSLDDRWVDNGWEGWNVTIDCTFDAPPAVLLPGESYPLKVEFSNGGTVTQGNPGAVFWYSSEWPRILDPTAETLGYFPWSPDFSGVNSKTWTLIAPVALRKGETFEMYAAWWNAPPCGVVWTYRSE